MKKEFRKILEAVNKDMGKDIMSSGTDYFAENEAKGVIPTGVPTLDLALGGGIPLGRVVEIYGKKSCGKSTLALWLCKESQKRGGYVVYFDIENGLEGNRAGYMGLDLENLTISHPSSIEEVQEAVDSTVRALNENPTIADHVLFIWDTPSFTLSEAEREATEFKQDMGKRAQRLRAIMRKIIDICYNGRVSFVSINHALDTVAARFPGMIDVPGGSAFKFGASLQVQMKIRGAKEEQIINEATKDQIGHGVAFKIDKTRMSVPKREAYARMNFFTGFDDEAGTVWDHLIERDIFQKEGKKFILPLPGAAEAPAFSSGPAGELAFRKAWESTPEFREKTLALMEAEWNAIVPWKSETVAPVAT